MSMVHVSATQYVLALLREAFKSYELAMDRVVRSIAKATWGDQREGADAVPKYIYKLRQCVGYAMKQHITEHAPLDAYCIGAVIIKELHVFIPPSVRRHDAASEQHQ